VDTTSTGKHEKSLFGGWLPRLEEAGNTDGEWTHTYTTCDLRDAQCELNQAVTVAAGNACRAPNSFAIQTVKELKAGTLISFIVVTYFTNMFTPHEYILRTRSRAPLSRVRSGSSTRHSDLIILSLKHTGTQDLEGRI
jgi:hypothetical protein